MRDRALLSLTHHIMADGVSAESVPAAALAVSDFLVTKQDTGGKL